MHSVHRYAWVVQPAACPVVATQKATRVAAIAALCPRPSLPFRLLG